MGDTIVNKMNYSELKKLLENDPAKFSRDVSAENKKWVGERLAAELKAAENLIQVLEMANETASRQFFSSADAKERKAQLEKLIGIFNAL